MLPLTKGPITAVLDGLRAGAMLLLAITPALRPLLGQTPLNPSLIAAAVFLLAGVAATAVALPTRKAQYVEPAVLLRQE